MDPNTPEYLDLYGQEPCYYGESLVLTGESMSQLGDMRWAGMAEIGGGAGGYIQLPIDCPGQLVILHQTETTHFIDWRRNYL